MRDSDWSRQNLLRSDWLGPSVASITTCNDSTNLLSLATSANGYLMSIFSIVNTV